MGTSGKGSGGGGGPATGTTGGLTAADRIEARAAWADLKADGLRQALDDVRPRAIRDISDDDAADRDSFVPDEVSAVLTGARRAIAVVSRNPHVAGAAKVLARLKAIRDMANTEYQTGGDYIGSGRSRDRIGALVIQSFSASKMLGTLIQEAG